jgi:hypothetical protein
MSTIIHLEVADEEVAKTFVEDLQETDSICYVNEAGDEVEFGVVKAEYRKVT